VHKLLNRAEDDSWHESRLSVQLEETDLAHIGWDDSGIADLDEPGASQVPDLDYDDLSATIRIYRPRTESLGRQPGVRVLPEKTMARVVGTENGFPLTVGAGEAVFVKVTNRFRTSATIAVVEKQTGQIWWSYTPTRTAASSGEVCALENATSDPSEFVVVGRQSTNPDNSPHELNSMNASVRFQQDAFISLMFDQAPIDPAFDDIKVDIIRMSPL
jgi:hypothetical protein